MRLNRFAPSSIINPENLNATIGTVRIVTARLVKLRNNGGRQAAFFPRKGRGFSAASLTMSDELKRAGVRQPEARIKAAKAFF